MYKIQPLYLLLSALLISINVFSQCPFNTKFGELKAEDFAIKSDLIDSSTSAIILFDMGSCEFINSVKGDIITEYKRHTRIKILNKNAYYKLQT